LYYINAFFRRITGFSVETAVKVGKTDKNARKKVGKTDKNARKKVGKTDKNTQKTVGKTDKM